MNTINKNFALAVLIFLLPINFALSQDKEIVKLKIQEPSVQVKDGKQFAIELDVLISSEWHINSNNPNDEYLIPTVITANSKTINLTNIDYPEAKEIKLSFSEVPVSVYEGKETFKLKFETNESAKPGKHSVKIQFEYQACNNVSCLPPNSVRVSFDVEILPGEKIEKEIDSSRTIAPPIKVDTIDLRESNILINPSDNNKEINKSQSGDTVSSTLEKSGLLLNLIFVFFAGLALNLTPCVYPLIPITIGYFGGQAEGKTSRLVFLGLLYMLGMAITYSVIGVITSLSGAVFGTLLQNPFVIVGIAILFVTLALSQFGVYEFKLPDSLVMKAGGAKGGIYGAFFMGLTMGIVAAPCIGPFVLGLVTYVAAKGDPLFGFLMFFVLAMGLGFPYLLLAVFSGKIKSLPRAGIWMEGIKHIFGFLLIGMAIYFLNPILPKSIQSYLLPVFGIIAVLILLFVDKTATNAKGFRIFKTIFSVLVLSISIYALVPSQKLEPAWQKFSIQAYETSLNKNEKMVVDFYADWCIPCKELDALTFSDPRVLEEMEKLTVYKVDMTKSSNENETLRKRFNVIGMPTVLVIDSHGNEISRLTGFVNADEFLGKLVTIP